MKVKEESEKIWLKLSIQKTKIMASSPITSWQIDGETVETVSDFILGGSKITADGDCSHESKRRLLLGRKVMTNLDSVLKSRDLCRQSDVSTFEYTVQVCYSFLPRSKHPLTSWLQSLSTVILEPKKIKSDTVSTYPPSICQEVMGLDAIILVF